MTVLVLGATGFVGSALVTALTCANETVRAAARTAPRSADTGWPGVRWIHCDLTRPETIPPALDGIDVAYYLVHSMGGHDDFRETDRRCARVIARPGAAPPP